ncbi:hypothetical protein HMSSN036_03060 [Paenibacillus macerans]|nr:hypothetical protein HMSSN036_03060 [Paenibacillus macerans]
MNDFKADLITRDVLEPLDDYFAAWEDKDLISPEIIASNRKLDAKEGKLYALPYSSQTWNLWVRPDWFKEAGLKLPETWPDFFTAVEKLTDKGKSRYGLSIRGGAGSANTLEMLMYSYSGITDYLPRMANLRSMTRCMWNSSKNIWAPITCSPRKTT